MNSLITLCLYFIISTAYGQFAGIVTYKDVYISKNPDISGTAFEKFIGTKRELHIQGAFYKTVHYGESKSIIIYRGDENKAYRFKEGADTIFLIDASLDTLSKIGNPKVEESDEVILGLKCKRLIIKSQLGTTTYYFNERYLISPSDFKNHRLESWDFYTAMAKSVPLKIVFDGEEIGFTSTAIKVEPEKLSDETFRIAKGYLKKLF